MPPMTSGCWACSAAEPEPGPVTVLAAGPGASPSARLTSVIAARRLAAVSAGPVSGGGCAHDLEHALAPVKPGQEADFEPAVAKAKAGSASSCGMPAASAGD
jgi:hypothetical protein